MPPIIEKQRKVQILTIGEKKQIVEFMTANPKEKLTNVAKIFTERLGKAGLTLTGRTFLENKDPKECKIAYTTYI